jgi:hypothetical protein
MKQILLVLLTGFILSFLSCATDAPAAAAAPAPATSPPAQTDADSEIPVELNEAIARIAEYFIANIPKGSKVAVTGVDAEHVALSDYSNEEFHRRLEDSRAYTMIGRGESREAAMREILFQNSGEISVDSLHKIGEALGPDTIVYGRIRPHGAEHRLVMYATDVQTQTSLMRPLNVNLPPQWKGPPPLEDKIDRAVIDLGRRLYTQTPLIVGSVCVTGTTASTTLSDYLRPRLLAALQKRGGLFRALDETSGNVSAETLLAEARTIAAAGGAAPVPARLVGEFPPRDEGEDVAVSLSLLSLAGGEVLGSASLSLSAREMTANRLSALPPNTTREKFEAKHKVLAEYSGKDNAFALRVQPGKAIYHEGDFLSFSIYAEEDCYFQILYYDAEDNVGLMFPVNARDWERNRLRAGETRNFPDTPRYLLRPPFGLEYVIVLAYRDQIQVKAERPAAVSPSALLRMLDLRGQVDLENPDNLGKPIQVKPAASASFSYTILEKR